MEWVEESQKEGRGSFYDAVGSAGRPFKSWLTWGWDHGGC